MAKGGAVWGIDIGQCALKALQCRPHEKDPRRLVVESFDYIEYPKILTQPEAEPAELVREALEQFLSRNDLTGDTVAISVAGQSGLARFIKLPPVESKKIPDIVKYEARQQIPFSLDDVVWDYQQLTGGSEEDGFALEPEVGLFAMKRDQVGRALAPLEAAGIEVDLIQLAPLAVYNYVCFDRFDDLRSQPYDPAKPPASTVVISLGTDTTDLVVTNGYRVWQRNIPIGGNHFTRALSKELKLTFVKAEHLKRNATQADDPKAVFQAMRPVFSDLLAEIQRSLGYFQSLDKAAHIGEVIALGNAMKLPGLQRYLAQNLEQDVKPIEEFNRLSTGSASGNAQFRENILSFGPAFGLCVQALGKSELRTNLLPEEIVRKRLIRSKKPWAVAGIAAVLAGITFNYFTHVSAWKSADVKRDDFAQAIQAATTTQNNAKSLEDTRVAIHESATKIASIQDQLVKNVEGRLVWLELLKALDTALPKDDRPREETAEHVMSRNELHITALDERQFADLETEYFATIESAYRDSRGEQAAEGEEGAAGATDAGVGAVAAAPAPAEPAAAADATAGGAARPSYVVQLTGYHYHNADQANQTAKFVRDTLIKNLEEGTVKLPDGYDPVQRRLTYELIDVPIKDLGISRPWIVQFKPLADEYIDPDAALVGEGGMGMGSRGYMELMPQPGIAAPGAAPAQGADEGDDKAAEAPAAEGQAAAAAVPPGMPGARRFKVRRYDFVVQFCWQPKTRTERRALAQARLEAEAAAADAAAAGGEAPPEGAAAEAPPADAASMEPAPAEAAPAEAAAAETPPAESPPAEGTPTEAAPADGAPAEAAPAEAPPAGEAPADGAATPPDAVAAAPDGASQ